MTEPKVFASDAQREAFEACQKNPPDFSIKLDGYEWHVHSQVLSQQSDFFKKACAGPFKEAKQKTVETHEDCPWTTAIMIRWFYRRETETVREILLQYKEETAPGSIAEKMMMQAKTAAQSDFDASKQAFLYQAPWKIYSQLYLIADKYAIDELKKMCEESLSAFIKKHGRTDDIMDALGMVVIAYNESLGRMLLERTWETTSSAQNWHTGWIEKSKGHPKLTKVVQNFPYEMMNGMKSKLKTMSTSMSQARTTLQQAELKINHRGDNQPAKEKIKEAKEILEPWSKI